MARIDEAHCIGCTLCIQACPVDAIVGANKRMHTVLADWCTGCDLCVAPCPVDCIDMVPAGRGWTAEDADISRQRHRGHQARLARLAADNARLMAAEIPDAPAPRDTAAAEQDEDRKRSAIESRWPAPGRRNARAHERRQTPRSSPACRRQSNPTTELEYDTPFQLLIAVLLSAQATDKSVNIATRKFFPEHGTPAAMLALGEDGLADYIKTIGLFRTKAKNAIATCRILLEQHGGEVPRTREELEALPGVGRKTANVVLNTAFGEHTMAVDTHIFRVSNRTGIAPGKTCWKSSANSRSSYRPNICSTPITG